MELAGKLAVGIGHPVAIRRVVLPHYIVIRAVLAGYFIEIIDVDIDVIAVMRVSVVMVIIVMMMIVIVVVVIVVIVPVDIAEQRIGGGNAEAIAEPFYKAVGELLAGRRGR